MICTTTPPKPLHAPEGSGGYAVSTEAVSEAVWHPWESLCGCSRQAGVMEMPEGDTGWEVLAVMRMRQGQRQDGHTSHILQKKRSGNENVSVNLCLAYSSWCP